MDSQSSRQCGKKVIYPEEALAIRAAKYMHKKYNGPFNHYTCPWCNGWHVGRDRSPEAGYKRSVRRYGDTA